MLGLADSDIVRDGLLSNSWSLFPNDGLLSDFTRVEADSVFAMVPLTIEESVLSNSRTAFVVDMLTFSSGSCAVSDSLPIDRDLVIS